MKSNLVRSFVVSIAGLGVAMLMAVPRPALAGIDPEVRAGVYPGAESVSLGGGLLVPVGERRRWHLNPNLETTVSGDDDFVALSGDVHYDFRGGSNTAVWMGGGPAVFWYERPGSDETDIGLNALAGVGTKRGQMRPFAQLRGTVADRNRIAISGGLRF